MNHSSYHFSGNRGGPERRRSTLEIKTEAKKNDWHIFDQELPLSRGFPKIVRGDFSHQGNAPFFSLFAKVFFEHIGLDLGQ